MGPFTGSAGAKPVFYIRLGDLGRSASTTNPSASPNACPRIDPASRLRDHPWTGARPGRSACRPALGQYALGAVGALALQPRLLGISGLPSRLAAPPLLLGDDLALNLAPELKRVGDSREPLPGSASAGYSHGAEAEHPADHPLIDGNRFDLAEQGFIGLALDEADLAQHPLIRHGEFGRDIANSRPDGQQQPDPGQTQPGVRVGRLQELEQNEEPDAEEGHTNGREKDGPVQTGAVHDALAGEKVVVEVAHGDKIVPKKEPRTCEALGTGSNYLLRYPYD